MNPNQPLIKPAPVHDSEGSRPPDQVVSDLSGETIRVSFVPGVGGDLERINMLSSAPDLYEATNMVDGLIECLQNTKVSELETNIDEICKDLNAFIIESTGPYSDLLESGRKGLAKRYQDFFEVAERLLDACNNIRDKPLDYIERFQRISALFSELLEAHGKFYREFMES